MIKTVMSHSLIVALLLGGSSAALSADLDNILYGPQAPTTKPVEVGNGWYLRGDVGYNFSTDGSADSFRMYDFTALSYDRVRYSDSEFDSVAGTRLAEIASFPTRAWEVHKMQVLPQLDLGFDASMVHCLGIRQTHLIEDRVEGIAAWRERRDPTRQRPST